MCLTSDESIERLAVRSLRFESPRRGGGLVSLSLSALYYRHLISLSVNVDGAPPSS